MVGHTHENIDQMFSCVARRLAKNDAHTLEILTDQIEISYPPFCISGGIVICIQGQSVDGELYE